MSETNDKAEIQKNNQNCPYLASENERLVLENQKLIRKAEDVAKANANAAELMVKLEESNEQLKFEIEKRKGAWDKLVCSIFVLARRDGLLRSLTRRPPCPPSDDLLQ